MGWQGTYVVELGTRAASAHVDEEGPAGEQTPATQRESRLRTRLGNRLRPLVRIGLDGRRQPHRLARRRTPLKAPRDLSKRGVHVAQLAMVRGMLTLAAEQLFAKTARHAANTARHATEGAAGGTGLTSPPSSTGLAYLAALCDAVARLGALLAARLAPTVQEVLPGLSPGAAPLMLDVLGALLAASPSPSP